MQISNTFYGICRWRNGTPSEYSEKIRDEQHGIIPRTVTKKLRNSRNFHHKEDSKEKKPKKQFDCGAASAKSSSSLGKMKAAAKLLEFEHAAHLRDKIEHLQGEK